MEWINWPWPLPPLEPNPLGPPPPARAQTLPEAPLPSSLWLRDRLAFPRVPWRDAGNPLYPGRMQIGSAEDVLVEFLTELFANYRLKTSREPFEQHAWDSLIPPAVCAGFIPKNVTGVIDPNMIPDYPRIVVQVTKVDDVFGTAHQESLMTIDILFGAYDQSPDYKGYRDVIHMFERARDAIWQEQIIGEELALREPFEFSMEKNYFPHFFGTLTTTWAVPTPEYKLMTTEHSYD